MYDEDLSPVLQASTEEQLGELVEFLLASSFSTLATDPRYEQHTPNHHKYVGAIVEQIHKFADHTIAVRLRKRVGYTYRDIVRAALAELGQDKAPLGIVKMERAVVERFLDTEFDRLPRSTQTELIDSFYKGKWLEQGLTQRHFFEEWLARVDPETQVIDSEKVQRVFKRKAIDLAKDAAKGKLLSTGLRWAMKGAAGPLGWGITAWQWLGPAWRITIPVICYVSYLRELHAIKR